MALSTEQGLVDKENFGRIPLLSCLKQVLQADPSTDSLSKL